MRHPELLEFRFTRAAPIDVEHLGVEVIHQEKNFGGASSLIPATSKARTPSAGWNASITAVAVRGTWTRAKRTDDIGGQAFATPRSSRAKVPWTTGASNPVNRVETVKHREEREWVCGRIPADASDV
jgi:hypothetical protein